MKDVDSEQEGLGPPNPNDRIWGPLPNAERRVGDPEEVLRLVQASRTGDPAAFDRLVLLHQRQAVGLALGILGNRDDAAEVVQEAFLKAHLNLGRLSQPERFRFWLLKIVANEAVSWRRAGRRRRRVARLLAAARVQRRSSEPHDKESAHELQKAVERALERLTDGEARAIALFGLDGLPQDEVARIMGCSAGVVRWHVHRARRKLRVLLKEYLE